MNEGESLNSMTAAPFVRFMEGAAVEFSFRGPVHQASGNRACERKVIARLTRASGLHTHAKAHYAYR